MILQDFTVGREVKKSPEQPIRSLASEAGDEGSRSPFTYNGHSYPALAGKWFPSVAAFCREAGIDTGFVYGRVHQGWPRLKALDLPKLETSDRLGTIYLVTRLSTGERYVGLTIVSVRSRWSQHVRSAHKRASPLGRAIFDDGADSFSV